MKRQNGSCSGDQEFQGVRSELISTVEEEVRKIEAESATPLLPRFHRLIRTPL